LFTAGQSSGFFDAGLSLSVKNKIWSARRWWWNLRQFRSLRYGGYQYSRDFLSRLWAQAETFEPGDVVLNCFQLWADEIASTTSIRRWVYIDQTLNQLFFYYGLARNVSKRTLSEAIEREKRQYETAEGIVTHSQWAADDVIGSYGIAKSKVYVVLPGANIDSAISAVWESALPKASRRNEEEIGSRPLRLVFVGKDWRRKGLDRLLGAVRVAHGAGANLHLLIIGPPKSTLPSFLQRTPSVTWAGFIDKRRDPLHFIKLVGSCDIGCLLSRAECGGISLREFHRLGLAAIASDTGGSPEHTLRDASTLVSPYAEDEEISSVLIELASRPSLVANQRNAAWRQRDTMTWDYTVARLKEIILSRN
jgi:glycosyltransferase involved in cell wall biosynthesis